MPSSGKPKQDSDLSETQHLNDPRELHRTKSHTCLLEKTQRQVSMSCPLPPGAAASNAHEDADFVEHIAELNWDKTQTGPDMTNSLHKANNETANIYAGKTLAQETRKGSPPSMSANHQLTNKQSQYVMYGQKGAQSHRRESPILAVKNKPTATVGTASTYCEPPAAPGKKKPVSVVPKRSISFFRK